MKLNNNGKPRKTFALAISIAEEQKEKAWSDIDYWSKSEEKWRAKKDDPEHAEHYKMCFQNLRESWGKWHGVLRMLHALEDIKNG
jgi:hypothetical protein